MVTCQPLKDEHTLVTPLPKGQESRLGRVSPTDSRTLRNFQRCCQWDSFSYEGEGRIGFVQGPELKALALHDCGTEEAFSPFTQGLKLESLYFSHIKKERKKKEKEKGTTLI